MADCLLSIIVPTRNRQFYAAKCASQILRNNDKRIELVIRDNSDEDILKSMLGDLMGDDRLIYDFSPTRVSFTQNFSDSINLSGGKYICFIGDDDGINHEIIDFTAWMEMKGIDAAKPEILTFYRWPYSDHADNINQIPGEMTVKKFSGKVSVIDTKYAVSEYLKGGGGSYLEYDLAKPYHGIVSRHIYDKIKKKTGSYFGGLTPDIYGAISISLLSEYCVAVDYPLTVPGECPRSGSADSRTGRHTGKLSDAPHFYGHITYNWNSLVPKFYSVETIWTDSALAAIVDLGMESMLNNLNLGALYFNLFRFYPDYFKSVKSAYVNLNKDGDNKYKKLRIWLQVFDELKKGIRRKRLRRFQKIDDPALDDIKIKANDIDEALDMLMFNLKEQEMNVNDIINIDQLHL